MMPLCRVAAQFFGCQGGALGFRGEQARPRRRGLRGFLGSPVVWCRSYAPLEGLELVVVWGCSRDLDLKCFFAACGLLLGLV